MKSPIERKPNTKKHKKGEGNQSEWRNIQQSENTYTSLNLDTVKEMKATELFNKEIDNHG